MAEVTATQPFSFVQITDIHVGYTVVPSAVTLAEDLRQVEREVGDRVAFVVATGDLTNRGTEEECLAYMEATRATRLKIHPVVGNHDYMHTVGKEMKNDAGAYQRIISPLNHSFDFNGVHFVSYDFMAEGNKSRPSEWLLKDLSTQPMNTPIIFLVHDQLHAAFYDQLKDHRIVATMSGHWHSSRLYHDGRIDHFNSPSLCFGGIDYSPRAYRVFTWDGTKLSCETIPFNKTKPVRAARQHAGLAWSAPLHGQVHLGSPVVSDGRVFLGLMNEDKTAHGAIACWDAKSGRELWRTTLSASVKNDVALHDGKVIGVTVTGEVAALDVRDGKRVWTHQLGDASQRWIFSSPLVHGDRVYTGQGPHFAALDAHTGKPLWVRNDIAKSDWISSYVSPACDGERVFIGFNWQPHSFHALDAQTGKTVWQLKRDEAATFPVSTPVLDGRGGLFAMLRRGQLSKLDAETGAVAWEFVHGDAWNPGAPCLDSDLVYAASGTGKLHAVDVTTGQERWQWKSGIDLAAMHPYRRTGETILSTPRLMGDLLLVSSNDGRLVALDKQSGALRWECDFGVPLSSSPTIADGRIFLAVRDCFLYALDADRIQTR